MKWAAVPVRPYANIWHITGVGTLSLPDADPEKDAANLRLILAVPTLLSALEDIAKFNSKSHGECAAQVLDENARIALAAIAEAKGEQS